MIVMARFRFNGPIEPMDLANMRANGVRCKLVSVERAPLARTMKRRKCLHLEGTENGRSTLDRKRVSTALCGA
jgi:hypothetical protein